MIWYYVGAMYYVEFLYYLATHPGTTCAPYNGGIACTGSW